jgi:hypothetical protein
MLTVVTVLLVTYFIIIITAMLTGLLVTYFFIINIAILSVILVTYFLIINTAILIVLLVNYFILLIQPYLLSTFYLFYGADQTNSLELRVDMKHDQSAIISLGVTRCADPHLNFASCYHINPRRPMNKGKGDSKMEINQLFSSNFDESC